MPFHFFTLKTVKVEFDWNDEKAESNLKKHKVSFEEATTVFDDLFNIDFYDPKHSIEEHRFLVVGESKMKRLLIVSYAERVDKIRIISARKLTPKERKIMNTENLNDELEPEYDFSKLKVRRVGAGRKLLQENQITLDVDVAKVFPDSEAVNQALRFLIRVTSEHQTELNRR